MTTIDRYILRVFARVLVISLLSMTSLYIVIDVFSNMEDFLAVSKQPDAKQVLAMYGLSRLLWIFDLLSPMLGLTGGVFALVSLQRSNEMAALMAAGISKLRIAMPVILGGIFVSGVAAGSRELLLPQYHDKVTRRIRDWEDGDVARLEPRYDYRMDVYFASGQIVKSEQRLIDPVFELPI